MMIDRQDGFTLIELMVSISVLAILIGISSPGMASMVAERDVAETQETIAQVLRNSRSMAMARGVNSTAAVDSAGKVVTLSVADGSMTARSYPISSRVTVSNNMSVAFNGYGVPLIAGGASSVSLTSSNGASSRVRTISISQGGQVYVAK